MMLPPSEGNEMTDIKPIRTEADYEDALAEVQRLMDSAPGSPQADRLDVLATLVEAYEAQHFALPLPDPIEAIRYHMESRGLTRRDLEPYLGGHMRVAEILGRRRPLSIGMIRRLHAGLGIPADVLIRPYPIRPRSEPPADATFQGAPGS